MYGQAAAVAAGTTVTIGAVASPGSWDRDGATAISPYKLTKGSPITVDAANP